MKDDEEFRAGDLIYCNDWNWRDDTALVCLGLVSRSAETSLIVEKFWSPPTVLYLFHV